ncbi:unnamed protein product [Miscanthus lutarioriparius]|uniref:Uncharacterized protein n=1 Tax=Miscanthus lutarioriparius TaxID=422564 RepID=A0A811R2S4_9POAL|nr:unnamed protein product [Miscanthus lutarioriparius]
MERDLVMPSWVMEVAAYGGAMESSPSRSRSSSGCQSGWTLYLDHSNGNGMRYLPCDDPAAQRWMMLQEDDDVEDSMASDASSGPRLLDQEDDTRRDFEQRPQGYIGQHSYSSSVHYCSASSDGSGGFGSSTWSSSRSSPGGVKGHVGRRGVVVHGGEATTRQYREIVIDEEDELDDTASSPSAVFCNPVAMVHVNFSSCRKHQRSSHELRNI